MEADSDSVPANRLLGAYLITVAALQAILYYAALLGRPDGWVLYNFEPRLGLFYLESLLRPGQPFPGVLCWASAIALAGMGFLLLLEVAGLGGYLIFETLLAAPTALLFLRIAVSGTSPGLGFSLLDLALPALPFALTSVLPVVYAWRVRSTLGPDAS